jgi:hypothetical protein
LPLHSHKEDVHSKKIHLKINYLHITAEPVCSESFEAMQLFETGWERRHVLLIPQPNESELKPTVDDYGVDQPRPGCGVCETLLWRKRLHKGHDARLADGFDPRDTVKFGTMEKPSTVRIFHRYQWRLATTQCGRVKRWWLRYAFR